MALAEELLDNISEEQAAEYALSELKPHIVIDEDRNIILPERYKKIASQGDHNMATYTFDCPRFSDGRDMSKMVVYINYIRSDGETGSYPADNVSIDAQNTDLMHFDWTLLLPATIEEGVLAFLVCVCKTGNDGKIENHWSSRMCREAMISEAMDCHKDTIVDLYPDIITRILERLNVLEDGGTTSVQYTIQDLEEEQKAQARKNIGAADAAEVSKLSEDIATKASAIKEKASGEVIVVTDSDEGKPLGLAIYGKSEQKQYSGKNLLKSMVEDTITHNGITWTKKPDGSIHVTGTKTGYAGIACAPVNAKPLIGKTLVLKGTSIKFRNGVRIVHDDDTETFIDNTNCDANFVLTIPETAKTVAYNCYVNAVSAVDETIYPQLENDTVSTDYEPYCGGTPSPNPSYPQEIRNIGVYDEASGKYAVELELSRGQLFDYNLAYAKVSVEDVIVNKEKVTFTTTNIYGQYALILDDLPSGTYTFGYESQSHVGNYSVELRAYYLANNVDDTLGNSIKETNTSKSLTFDYDKTKGRLLLFTRPNGATTITYTKLGLYSGNSLGVWTPCQETTATVHLDEPLRKGDKAYWNGGSKVRVDRNRTVAVYDGVNLKYEGYGVSDLGNVIRFVVPIPKDALAVKLDATALCDCLKYHANYGENTEHFYIETEQVWIFIPNEAGTTQDEINNYLKSNPITVEYTLATPITEEIDIDLGELSMFYPTTILSNDCNANMEVTYIADTKAYVDKKITEVITAML